LTSFDAVVDCTVADISTFEYCDNLNPKPCE